MSQEKPSIEDADSDVIRKQLYTILSEEVEAHTISEQDRLILSLRLGLQSEKYYTLIQVGEALHMLPERVRQRQYFLLRRKIKNPSFFKLLKIYALSRKLPPGFDRVISPKQVGPL